MPYFLELFRRVDPEELRVLDDALGPFLPDFLDPLELDRVLELEDLLLRLGIDRSPFCGESAARKLKAIDTPNLAG